MYLLHKHRRAMVPLAGTVLAATMVLAGCQQGKAPVQELPASEPTQAVSRLAEDLAANDLVAYARHALPAPLHARISAAWDRGDTIWPLTSLPLDDRIPALLGVLAEPEAEKALLAGYNQQFAGADRELRTAAATLGLFASQYLGSSGDYSDDERDHYRQLVAALAGWAQQAPLGDAALARDAVPQLVAAARLTGLAGADSWQRIGMERSLTRLGPFLARLKQVLVGYGLDIDGDLRLLQVRLLEQTGERARVGLSYSLAGQPVEAVVRVERRGSGWYLSDLLRHAESEAGAEEDPRPDVGAADAVPAEPAAGASAPART